LETTAKLEIIKKTLTGQRVLVALSGGVDSSVMAKLALDLLGYDQVLAVTVSSETMAASELEIAQEIARIIGIRHTIISVTCLEDPRFVSNPVDRCYYCKHNLYSAMLAYAHEHGFTMLVEGTNRSDQADYRPGVKALQEMGIISPFQASGITKEEIRELAKEYGLINWNRPSNACLASRFPYGVSITAPDLKRIETAENLLHAHGFNNCRLRHHGDVARIEVPSGQLEALLAPAIRSALISAIKALGYKYVTVDLEGYRTGSLNEVIPT